MRASSIIAPAALALASAVTPAYAYDEGAVTGGGSIEGQIVYKGQVQTRKIITHANKKGDAHDFYNPTQHPFFDREGGRVIYLEGSYVNTFSGNPHPTPRYEYNQVMYRLDLSDPRLRSSKP